MDNLSADWTNFTSKLTGETCTISCGIFSKNCSMWTVEETAKWNKNTTSL